MDKDEKKRIKAIQEARKYYFKDDPCPFNNKLWKKEWKDFIKHDADWDGMYLFDLILFKIEKMRITQAMYSIVCEEELNKILGSMDEAVTLGKKIRDHDYYEASHTFSEEHCAHVIYLYYSEEKGIKALLSKEIIHKFVQPRKKHTDDETTEEMWEDFSGQKMTEKWAQENGYDITKIHRAYGGEWDTKENQKTYRKMVKAEVKAYQKDVDNFFKILAKNIFSWWY